MWRARVCVTWGRCPSRAFRDLHDVEAVGAAQDVRHLARLGPLEGLEEDGGQAPGGAPAEVPALQGIRRVGIGGGDLRERGALANLGQRLHGAATPVLDLLRRGLLRNQDQDVLQPVLHVDALLGRARELRLHLGIGDHDGALDLAFAQAGEGDLLAHVLAEAVVGDAVALQRRRKADIDMLLSSAMRCIAFSTMASSTLIPVSFAICVCTISLTRRSRIWACSAPCGGTCPPPRCSCCVTARSRSESSSLRDDLVVHHRHDAIDGDDVARRRGGADVGARRRCLLGEGGCGRQGREQGGQARKGAGFRHRGISSDRR